jgi:hypothetical protein
MKLLPLPLQVAPPRRSSADPRQPSGVSAVTCSIGYPFSALRRARLSPTGRQASGQGSVTGTTRTRSCAETNERPVSLVRRMPRGVGGRAVATRAARRGDRVRGLVNDVEGTMRPSRVNKDVAAVRRGWARPAPRAGGRCRPAGGRPRGRAALGPVFQAIQCAHRELPGGTSAIHRENHVMGAHEHFHADPPGAGHHRRS